MASESGQKETPGPLDRKRSRKGARGIQKETPAPIYRKRLRKGFWGAQFKSVINAGVSQNLILQYPECLPVSVASQSTNGATYDSPGHRPGFRLPLISQALKGRHTHYTAPTGLDTFLSLIPRAMPWAIVVCPFGAVEREAA